MPASTTRDALFAVLRSVRLADSTDTPPPHAQRAARHEHTHSGLSESAKDIPRDR